MPALTPEQQAFWDAFRAARGDNVDARFHEAFFFADTQPVADALAELVLSGTKRATASLLWAHEAEGTQPTVAGTLSIVTDYSGTPLAIIEVTDVQFVPFDDVTADFAYREGEGDRSLAYWRDVHWRYFARECAAIGRMPDARMLVACESFVVCWPPEVADADGQGGAP
jgi:uncharacterized protein YhfF